MKSMILSLAVCLSLALVSAESDKYKEGYQYLHQKRLGHFNESPFLDLYKLYATAFVAPEHPERDNDDYRNFLPSGEECMVFFRAFTNNDHKLVDLDKFIVLDACLGYLFDGEEIQKFELERNPNLAQGIATYSADEKLKSLFEHTRVAQFPDEAKDCLGDFLVDVVRVKREFPDLSCNNHWLKVFTDFAACYPGISDEAKDSDSYIIFLRELLKKRATECFEMEIGHINEAARLRYVGSNFETFKKVNFLNKLQTQASGRYWIRHIVKLLSTVQKAKKEVNIRQVHQLLRGIMLNDEKLKRKFLDNMSFFANNAIDTKNKRGNAADPNGDIRYTQAVDRLCPWFRQTDNEKDYDFVTPFQRMVEMLKYEELLGVSQDMFVKKVFGEAWESAPVYLGVSMCNVLTFTEGYFTPQQRNHQRTYNVVFAHDTSRMTRWPVAGYY